jgi:hypothetical protein
MTNKVFEAAITHGMREYIGGHRYYHYHWYARKIDAKHDAQDAREYGYNARVVQRHGGWTLLIRRKL